MSVLQRKNSENKQKKLLPDPLNHNCQWQIMKTYKVRTNVAPLYYCCNITSSSIIDDPCCYYIVITISCHSKAFVDLKSIRTKAIYFSIANSLITVPWQTGQGRHDALMSIGTSNYVFSVMCHHHVPVISTTITIHEYSRARTRLDLDNHDIYNRHNTRVNITNQDHTHQL